MRTFLFYFKLAWRNLWRAKKRTLIAVSSILFAVFFALMMRSVQIGMHDNIVFNTVSSYCGFAQIASEGFKEHQSIDKAFICPDSLITKVKSIRHVTDTWTRLENFAMIASSSQTKSVMTVGIDPNREAMKSKFEKRMLTGRWLTPEDNGTVIAEGVAKFLKLSVGDTLVFYSSGFHGMIAADRIPVVGIIRVPSPFINDRMIYFPLTFAQTLYSAENRISTMGIMIDNRRLLEGIIEEVQSDLPAGLEVNPWYDIIPGMQEALEMDSAGGLIMLLILYVIVGLGILGTLVMMTLERTQEYAMMLAIGMKRSRLMAVSLLESVLIVGTGVISGILFTLPIILYLHFNPIWLSGSAYEAFLKMNMEPVIAFSVDPVLFLNQIWVVLGIGILVSIYPLQKIHRLEIVPALKS